MKHLDQLSWSSFFLLALCIFFLYPASGSATMQNSTVGFITSAGGLGDESLNDMTYKGLADIDNTQQ